MEHRELAAMFKALGDPTRLRIYQLLQASCCPISFPDSEIEEPMAGSTVGEICCCLTGKHQVSSTISFHLKEMRQAGLIVMEKRGKHVICSLHKPAQERLAGVLGAQFAPLPSRCRCKEVRNESKLLKPEL